MNGVEQVTIIKAGRVCIGRTHVQYIVITSYSRFSLV